MVSFLILLGLVCQGYTWERTIVPVAFSLFWGISFACQRPQKKLSQVIEGTAMLLAFILCKYIAESWHVGYNKLIFMGGNVLVVYQLIHSLYPKDQRQKRIAILIAIMHIGIGTQVIVDYKAILLIAFSIFLIPSALYDVEMGSSENVLSPQRTKRWEPLVLSALMVVFFLLFPRFPFKSSLHPPFAGGRGALSPEVDAAKGSRGGDNQAVFQIEGRNIGYMKCFSLDAFDGVRWSASHWMNKMARPFSTSESTTRLYRSVRMFDYRALQSVLPTDGFVQKVKLDYPGRLYLTGDGTVKLGSPLRYNVSYVYWMEPSYQEKLTFKEEKRYLQLPRYSPRLDSLLQDITSSELDNQRIAQLLVHYLQKECRYELGAPDLDRINPVEDFIFEEKKGHCERFASTLAVLLRMKGIPSRVAVGYVPAEYNQLGEFFTIRNRHAHAWTEAFFPGVGWKILDATPAVSREQDKQKNLTLTLVEWIEYVWYAKVVEFTVQDQQAAFQFFAKHAREIFDKRSSIGTIIFYLVTLSLTIFLLYKMIPHLKRETWRRLLRWIRKKDITSDDDTLQEEARHFYGEMIRALSKDRFLRQSSQTPWEFMNDIEKKGHPLTNDIYLVTKWFCAIRYGKDSVPPNVMKEVQKTVVKIVAYRFSP